MRAFLLVVLTVGTAAAQTGDSLRLRDATTAALNADPRQRQIALK